MKVIIALCLIFAVGIARGGLLGTTLVRTPSLDSYTVKTDRIGGNFAYSTIEGHAYAAISPVVQSVVVAAPIAHVPLIHHNPVIAAHPIISSPGIIAQAPAITAPIVGGAPISIPAPVGSPSSVVVDEDTVAIESA